MEINLKAIDHPLLLSDAIEMWEKDHDVIGIMCNMSSTACLSFVVDNFYVLQEVGKYEEALMFAYTGTL